MKKYKILLVTSFIILFLSLNALYATEDNNVSTLVDDNHYDSDALIKNNDIITDNNQQKQADNNVYVDINSDNGYEDGSMDHPYKTINEENLEKISSDSTIYVSRGTYTLNSTKINKNIQLIGESRDSVIFLANGSNSTFIIDQNIKVTFKNFTLKDFSSNTNSAITNNGYLLIDNVNMMNNLGTTSSVKGGAIVNNGELEINDSTFSGNSASFGAAIYNYKNLKISNSTFDDNYIGNVGGAIYSIRGNLTVSDSKFSNNRAVSGAAIYNAAGYAYINNTEFIENNAEHFFGGGIYSTGITITENCLFDSNRANMDGGAITTTSNFTVINCTFVENFANENGGAIENVAWSAKENGNLTIINSSFSDNAAGGKGGAIINYHKVEAEGEPAVVTARNTIFEYNSASIGGLIYNEEYMDFQYNAIINNEAESYNTIYSEEKGIKSIDNNWWGTNNPSVDEIDCMPQTWVMLEFTNRTQLTADKQASIRISLNTLNNGETINTTIPQRTVTFSAEKTQFAENDVDFIAFYDTEVLYEGDVLRACVDNQEVSLQNAKDIIISLDTINDTAYNEIVTVTGTVTDNEGNTLSDINLNIVINNIESEVTSDENGAFTYTTKAKMTGQNNVTVSFMGNGSYNPYETSATFHVDKANVTFLFYKIKDAEYNSQVKISGKLLCNGEPVIREKITITINDDSIEYTTSTTGYFIIYVDATTTGVNNLTYSFDGSSKYYATANNTTFMVKKSANFLFYKIKDTDFGNVVKISGKLLYDGNPVKKQNVTVTINDETFTFKTSTTGYFTMNYTTKTAGVNNITFTFEGGDEYFATSNTTTFNVKNDTTFLYYNIRDAIMESPVKISAKLLSGDVPAKRQNVTVKVNDETFNLTTSTTGYIVMQYVPNSIGTYNLTFIFEGSDAYYPMTNSTTFVVREA